MISELTEQGILIYFDIPTASKLECISRLILLQGKVRRYVYIVHRYV